MSFINESSIKDLYQKAEEASKKATMVLRKAFEEIGLMLEDIVFEGIDVPPEYRERVFWILQGTAPAYLVQQETARKFAEALKETQASGAVLGTGMVAIPYALQPPPPGAQIGQAQIGQPSLAGYVARCPYCGQGPIPTGAKYCPFCGKQIKWCSNNHVVPVEANYCPVCGVRVQ